MFGGARKPAQPGGLNTCELRLTIVHDEGSVNSQPDRLVGSGNLKL